MTEFGAEFNSNHGRELGKIRPICSVTPAQAGAQVPDIASVAVAPLLGSRLRGNDAEGSPARAATASPELRALLAAQRQSPPTLYQLRMLDAAVREAAAYSGREERHQRALERVDPSAMANNARRLRAIQRAHETGGGR